MTADGMRQGQGNFDVLQKFQTFADDFGISLQLALIQEIGIQSFWGFLVDFQTIDVSVQMFGKHLGIINASTNLFFFGKFQVRVGTRQRPNDRHHFYDIQFGQVLNVTDTRQNQKIGHVGVHVGDTP